MPDRKRIKTSHPGQFKQWRQPGDLRRDANGYILIYVTDDPRAKHNWLFEHRVVAEQMLGRQLRDGEVVHHINGDRADNREENLQVFASHSAHILYEKGDRCKHGHFLGRDNTATRYSRGKPYRQCIICERAKVSATYYRRMARRAAESRG